MDSASENLNLKSVVTVGRGGQKNLKIKKAVGVVAFDQFPELFHGIGAGRGTGWIFARTRTFRERWQTVETCQPDNLVSRIILEGRWSPRATPTRDKRLS
jgi:hypothetical protein